MPLSENPNELEALSPGHFLIGSSLTSPLEGDLTDLKENRLNRWELCSRLKQEFWKKWSSDYIVQLQKRNKWTESRANLKIGDMVLLMDENNAPLRWPLARITKTYCGTDGLVRVVDILTKGKIYKRPVGKLSPLPINNENEAIPAIKKDDVEANSVKNSLDANKCNESNDEYEKKNKKRSTKSMSIAKKATLAIVAMLAIINGVYSEYSIERFPENTTVYVEKCDDIMISTSTWNLMLRYDIGNYFEEIMDLRELTYAVQSTCSKREKNEIRCDCMQQFWTIYGRKIRFIKLYG